MKKGWPCEALMPHSVRFSARRVSAHVRYVTCCMSTQVFAYSFRSRHSAHQAINPIVCFFCYADLRTVNRKQSTPNVGRIVVKLL